MERNKALFYYLLGAIGQILLVCAIVYVLRNAGLIVDYSSPLGLVAIAVGGISSALWGIILSMKYRRIKLTSVIADTFKIKQSYKNYMLVLLFLFVDFFPALFGGRILINAWYLPIVMFFKHIAFGGIEEIGWRYFFQPVLQERISYVLATIITFVAWGIWHFLYFFLEGTIWDVDVLPFLLGLLTNSFILSALYTKTKNLWLCVMTHSLINVCSQLFIGGNEYVSYICKVLIIIIAIILVVVDSGKAKEQRVESDMKKVY
ncbi:MAG: CPBP family intramembrane metalloprotease [Lachnospiraceae bacterium]|nr:CPBP family intramembrane metalloprotease [Lachnospiraceae bacterium]